VFLGEYTAGGGYQYSATNDLIYNFKKPMDRRGKREWPHKSRNIQLAAEALFKAFGNCDLHESTFVPVPPSKAPGDPMYDDRMISMLNRLSGLFHRNHGYHLDIKELVQQNQSMVAFHQPGTGTPRNPDVLVENYGIQEHLLSGIRDEIIVCDDVITTGSHFRAMETVIQNHLSNATVRGVFLARREA